MEEPILRDVRGGKGWNTSLCGKSISTICPIQGRIQSSGFDQLGDLSDPRVAPGSNVSESEPSLTTRSIELLGAFAGGPLGAETRQ